MKKRITVLLICALLTVCLTGCRGEAGNSKALFNGKSLKMLAITSSFGLNTTEYLYDIAKAEAGRPMDHLV